MKFSRTRRLYYYTNQIRGSQLSSLSIAAIPYFLLPADRAALEWQTLVRRELSALARPALSYKTDTKLKAIDHRLLPTSEKTFLRTARKLAQ